MSTLDHLFDGPDGQDRLEDLNEYEGRKPSCNRCGSSAVRWRQQGGRWVLFSLTPGVEHACDPRSFSDDFDNVEA